MLCRIYARSLRVPLCHHLSERDRSDFVLRLFGNRVVIIGDDTIDKQFRIMEGRKNDTLSGRQSNTRFALNRAVAVANVRGPKAGIEAVEAIRNREQLKSYYLLYTILGEFEALLNNPKAAVAYFRKSLELATIKSEKKFLSKRLRSIEVTIGSEL